MGMAALDSMAAALDAERRRVDARMADTVAWALQRVSPAVAEPARYAAEGGGKRFRPLLCIAAFRAAGGKPEAEGIRTVAAAIELLHTYSLVHDDLPCMDDDDLRRGRPTVHRVFDHRAAAVAGAALIPVSARVLDRGGAELGLPGSLRLRMVAELMHAAGAEGMVGGQLLDLEAEGRELRLEELTLIHARKTGALFAASLRIGAIAAGADDPAIAAFGRCGQHLGLAFQIMDDVLDETGDPHVLGKTAGKDRAFAKATFVSLLGAEEAGSRAEQEAERARQALRTAGIRSPELEHLILAAVRRDS